MFRNSPGTSWSHIESYRFRAAWKFGNRSTLNTHVCLRPEPLPSADKDGNAKLNAKLFQLVSHLKRFGVLGALRAQKNHALACFQIELTIAYIKHINHSILHISAVLDIPHCFSVLNPAGQPKLARSPAAVFGSVLGGERKAFSRKVWREKEKEEGKKFWYTIIWHDSCYSCYIVHVNSCLCLWRFWCFTDVSCLTCLFALESKHSTA